MFFELAFNFVATTIQGKQLNMAMFFWYIVKSDFSSLHVYIRVHWDKSLYVRYQENMAMFNW